MYWIHASWELKDIKTDTVFEKDRPQIYVTFQWGNRNEPLDMFLVKALWNMVLWNHASNLLQSDKSRNVLDEHC